MAKRGYHESGRRKGGKAARCVVNAAAASYSLPLKYNRVGPSERGFIFPIDVSQNSHNLRFCFSLLSSVSKCEVHTVRVACRGKTIEKVLLDFGKDKSNGTHTNAHSKTTSLPK